LWGAQLPGPADRRRAALPGAGRLPHEYAGRAGTGNGGGKGDAGGDHGEQFYRGRTVHPCDVKTGDAGAVGRDVPRRGEDDELWSEVKTSRAEAQRRAKG